MAAATGRFSNTVASTTTVRVRSTESRARISHTRCSSAGIDSARTFRSSVSSPAYPSRTDAEQAFWPDATYVIVSLAGGCADIKGYRIVEMAVTEQPLSFE